MRWVPGLLCRKVISSHDIDLGFLSTAVISAKGLKKQNLTFIRTTSENVKKEIIQLSILIVKYRASAVYVYLWWSANVLEESASTKYTDKWCDL